MFVSSLLTILDIILIHCIVKYVINLQVFSLIVIFLSLLDNFIIHDDLKNESVMEQLNDTVIGKNFSRLN